MSNSAEINTVRAVVLLSGGLDSAVTLALARRDGARCTALSFNYGQRHRAELDAASRLAAALGAERHIVLPIDLRAIGGSALTSDIAVPRDRSGYAVGRSSRTSRFAPDDIPITYVPARNLIFLSIAAGLAEVLGARSIYIGVNAIDYSGYPDCRSEFIESFARCAALGTKAGVKGQPVEIRAPLIELAKSDIVRLGVSLGVDFSQTHSCYDPDPQGRACAHCDSCLLRMSGFADAGVPDPTIYAPGGGA